MIKTMKAVRYDQRGPPSNLYLADIDIPTPAADEVLVKVAYAGINPVDSHLRGTAHPFLQVSLPATPGKDAAGIVEEVGSNVTAFRKGDRVFVSNHAFKSLGAYTQFHLAKENEVYKLPESYSFQEGAAIGSPYFTATKALLIAGNATKGDKVLVHGASGQVGMACIQLGVSHGLEMYGTAGTQEGIERILKNGAKAAFNHRENNYPAEIQKALGPEGPKVIIEMSAGVNLQSDIDLVARKGRVVIVGTHGLVTVNPSKILAKEATITAVKLAASTPEEWTFMDKVIQDGLKQGILRPTIGKVYEMTEVVQAHEDLESSATSSGKALLKVADV